MSVYSVQELINRLSEIKKDGYTSVELSFLDIDGTESLSFEVADEFGDGIDYETVDSIE